MPVRSCEFDYWVRAAGWLGRMHGYFARDSNRLKACDFLLRYDTDFFWEKAELAIHAVSQISIPLVDRLESIVNRYQRPVNVMAGQLPTLVHGSYRPKNILVNINCRPLRVCPIDWELAACGSALYDLASFSEGFEPPKLDHLVDAYRQEVLESNAPVPDRKEIGYVVDCFCLHRIMNWLSRTSDKKTSEHEVAKLVDLAERLGELIL